MDSIKEEKEEESELVKTYLQIHYPKIEDKPYYKIDLHNNILYLFDSINRKESDNNGIFEMNKIFTNECDNSSIYQEICSNIIKDSLKGESSTFISYGNTISDKLKILIGDVNESYTKVEQRGLFPKILDNLITTINNDKSYRENLSINLSFFSLYYDKFIDLSNFIGQDFSNFNEDNFFEKIIEISKENDNLKKLKKVPTENINDVLFFTYKLFLSFMKLEEESDYHIYSRSHFSIIIYIINNNGIIASTLTFILLNGSEIIDKYKHPQKNNTIHGKSHKKIVSNSSVAVDSQFTYDSIIFSLKNNKYINKIEEKEQLTKNAKKIFDYTEKNKISKLSTILYDICFSPYKKNIKFIIIGTILPNTGYYNTVKDTLMFLFNCRQAIFNNSKSKNNRLSIDNLNSNEYKNKLKDDMIFDLENKIKIQANKIGELNKTVEKKNDRIISLERNYKEQVNILKNYFGYTGSIEILLSDDEYTPEYQEAKKIREAKDNIRNYKKNIINLENKIKKKDEEIKKLKIEEDIKKNEETMVKYYLGVNSMKKTK